MDFSVLMSVYEKDNPEFFKSAIFSVTLWQFLKPTQLVIVKDGPVSEEIDRIICECSLLSPDIEFTVITKEENAGLAAALNTGLGVCKYEWVARMDSDDISTPDRFEKQIKFIKENSNVSVIGGTISEFADDPKEIVSIREVELEHDAIVNMAKTRTPMNHMTVMYKKSAVKSVGGYSENFGKLEDYKLWVDLISSGYLFANLKDVIVNVRIGNGFIERRSNKWEIFDWDMLQGYLLKAGIITHGKAVMNKLYIRIFIYMPAWMKKITYKTLLRR